MRGKQKTTALPPSRPPQEVFVDGIYPVQAFRARLGLSASAWRSMLRAGLPVYAFGKRRFVAAADFLAFLQRNGRS